MLSTRAPCCVAVSSREIRISSQSVCFVKAILCHLTFKFTIKRTFLKSLQSGCYTVVSGVDTTHGLTVSLTTAVVAWKHLRMWRRGSFQWMACVASRGSVTAQLQSSSAEVLVQ